MVSNSSSPLPLHGAFALVGEAGAEPAGAVFL